MNYDYAVYKNMPWYDDKFSPFLICRMRKSILKNPNLNHNKLLSLFQTNLINYLIFLLLGLSSVILGSGYNFLISQSFLSLWTSNVHGLANLSYTYDHPVFCSWELFALGEQSLLNWVDIHTQNILLASYLCARCGGSPFVPFICSNEHHAT